MPNFKVGDRVIVTGGHWFSKGETVTVVEVDPTDSACTYRCSDGVNKWWVRNENIEPISKFSVGQIYRVGGLSCQHQYESAIIKLNGIRPFGFTIKAIRGNTPNDFASNSEYARSLTLLTGKEIGEAIKAFDEKKTGGVKEVKRKARVGEYIKILVNLCGEVQRGAIGKVTSIYGASSRNNMVYFSFGSRNDWLAGALDGEYVVLEGYSPVKEVKRKAKVGEYVKSIGSNGGFIYPNTIFLVESVNALGGLNVHDSSGIFECTNTISSDNYVVLEGYEPDSLTGTIHIAGKHIWKPEEVERAKTIVLDTIRELAENRKYVSFSFLGRTEDANGFYAYVYGGEKCHLGATRVGLVVDKYERAMSKCSPTDEPNEWIGKCVALCKVLHKPIPAFIMGD